jgi:hypothetical protein
MNGRDETLQMGSSTGVRMSENEISRLRIVQKKGDRQGRFFLA